MGEPALTKRYCRLDSLTIKIVINKSLLFMLLIIDNIESSGFHGYGRVFWDSAFLGSCFFFKNSFIYPDIK